MSANGSVNRRRYHPSAERNKGPILAVLSRVLPPAGTVLEIASGTGQHVVHFAAALPQLTFQPSDPDPASRASVAGWIAEIGVGNVLPPLDIDVRRPDWGVEAADAVVCVNMIHIAPWACAEGLIAGAARQLPPNGPLVIYGPFKRGGAHTAPSNAAFDASLRAQDPDWGIRDLEAVQALGEAHGFVLEEIVEMPANNLTVILRKQP
jgi:SAM-dependent methyltransferase